jgi:hypothetical protein
VILEYLDGWVPEEEAKAQPKRKFLLNKSKSEGGKENV